MNYQQILALDTATLESIAKMWEEEYFKTYKAKDWKGYVMIMNKLGKINEIPTKAGLKAHLNVLAMMDKETA